MSVRSRLHLSDAAHNLAVIDQIGSPSVQDDWIRFGPRPVPKDKYLLGDWSILNARVSVGKSGGEKPNLWQGHSIHAESRTDGGVCE
jgi:hypothetical protein